MGTFASLFCITAPPGDHPQYGPANINGGNFTTGCRVGPNDGAWSQRSPWGNGGDYKWRIPAQWINSGTRYTFGSDLIHWPTLEANGDAEMAKDGAVPGGDALNDPTSGYY